MIEFIMNELKAVAEDFCIATGITCVIYDDSRKVVYSYPGKLCSFCTCVRTEEKLFDECIRCDMKGMDTVDSTLNSHTYKCHMNLTEAIAPVLEDDKVIGYVMLGGVINKNDYDTIKQKTLEICHRYHMNEAELMRILDSMPKTDCNKIKSAVSLMKICGKYLYFNKIMKYKSDNISVKIKKYIEEHYRQKISIAGICRDLYISESKLYSVSKAIFGMGASDYIRELRNSEAKKLLENTELSVSSIASEVGYDDNNYFIRIFKKMNGCTPAKYRKNKAPSINPGR